MTKRSHAGRFRGKRKGVALTRCGAIVSSRSRRSWSASRTKPMSSSSRDTEGLGRQAGKQASATRRSGAGRDRKVMRGWGRCRGRDLGCMLVVSVGGPRIPGPRLLLAVLWYVPTTLVCTMNFTLCFVKCGHADLVTPTCCFRRSRRGARRQGARRGAPGICRGRRRSHETYHGRLPERPRATRDRGSRRRQRSRRSRGGPGRGARRRAHDPGRPLRLLRRRHHAGRRREHRLVPARGHRRPRGHRHRVRAARQGHGRHPAGVAVAQRGARSPSCSRSSPTRSSRRPASSRSCTAWLRSRSWTAAPSRRDRPRASPAGRRSSPSGSSTPPATPTSPSARGAVPLDARRRDDGSHRHVLVLGRRQTALPRLRQGTGPDLQGLEQELAGRDERQGGRPLQPLSPGALRAGTQGRPHPRGRDEHRRHLGPHLRRGRGDLPQHGLPARATTAPTCAT